MLSRNRPVPILRYADPPSRWGITVQRHPGGLRVIVPPVPSWWHLPGSYLVVVLIGGALAAFFSFQAVGIGAAPDPSKLVDSALYGFVALVAIAHAIWRLRQRFVLDVTGETFALACVGRSGRGHRAIWKRSEIRNVELNVSNGNLLVRIGDRDFVEYPICPDREVVQWLADIVREAVFNGEFDAIAGPAFDLFPAPRRPVSRMWLPPLAIAAILASLAAPFLAYGGRTHLAFALVVSLTIGMTILCVTTYGAREKDYFT